MPTDAVVGALASPSVGLNRIEAMLVAPLLPAILRATLPHWSAEDDREVLEALVTKMAKRGEGGNLGRRAQRGGGAGWVTRR